MTARVAAAPDNAVPAGALSGERVAGAARTARDVTAAREARLRAGRTVMVLLQRT